MNRQDKKINLNYKHNSTNNLPVNLSGLNIGFVPILKPKINKEIPSPIEPHNLNVM